ncbi:Bifunctional dehydrogenase and ferrochelatase [Tulasnella sp. 424]|nr:Bifunctional dehydrogenase and ferrochelatase [Tulasnella sp. 424]KAG8972292.1 Bifunctional dehydrogenase and ferrochelatase [Tulasnella sp. 425]
MADSSDSQPFAPVTPGGSLIIAWQLRDKRVLLVGGGHVASGRLSHLLDADALVTLISPKTGLHPLVIHRIFEDDYAKTRITYLDRPFAGEQDLDGMDMVLTAIDDVELSRSICHMARARKIPVNVADVPPECDFYFGSMIRKGPLQVMVSTGGKGPKLANIIRRKMEDALPDNVGDAIERVGELRAELRKRAPGVGGRLGQKRMDWMTKVCETWSLDELGQLDEAAIEFLLDHGWSQKARVPSFEEVWKGLSRPSTTKLPRFEFHPPEPLLSRYLSPDFCVGVALGLLVSLSLYMHRSR